VSAKLVPVTAAVLAACLFVAVGDARTATAVPTTPAAGRLATQHFAAPPAPTTTITRDGYEVDIDDDGHRWPSTTITSTVVRPVEGAVPIAGGFGGRHVAGCGACSTNHHGLDFAAPSGSPALAAMSGRVVSAGVLGGYGNQVLLQHPDGTRTRYGHLSRIDVRVGQVVTAGEQVGAVGSTGVSTGPHLHFEVIVGGVPVDPEPWLAARGVL